MFKFRIIFLICMFFNMINFIYAGDISVDFESSVGLFFGNMSEEVYENDKMLSKLDWEEKFVPFLNAKGRLLVKNAVLTLGAISALPVECGVMRDYDWMIAGSSALSHFSEHRALFDKHLELNGSLGLLYSLWIFDFTAAAGFKYRGRKWSGTGGFLQYPPTGQPWSPDTPKRNLVGTIITYEESILFPELKFTVSYKPLRFLEIELLSRFIPYLELSTIDTHVIRSERFYDEMKGGLGFSFDLTLRYNPVRRTNGAGFFINVGYENIMPEKGSSASGNLGYENPLTKSDSVKSGTSSVLYWISFGTCFKFI